MNQRTCLNFLYRLRAHAIGAKDLLAPGAVPVGNYGILHRVELMDHR
jgi:hypothetical protein